MQLPSNRAASGIAGMLILTGLASAVFDNAFAPGFRGTTGSEFSQWENFTVPFAGPNAPDDPTSTSDDAAITQTTPGAIITSTMNIYNPGAASKFVLSDSVTADLQEVFLQVRTQGVPLAVPPTTLEYSDSAGTLVVLPADFHEERWNSGGVIENLFRWDLEGEVEEVLDYTLRFEASAPNLSLDTVQLDTRFGEPFIGTAYCQAEPTSTGSPASLVAIGSDVAASNDVTLRASGLPLNQFGYFVNSDMQGFVPLVGGSQGNLCLAGGIGRHLSLLGNSGLTGELEGSLDLTQLPRPSGGPVGVMAGQTWNFQCWFRDLNPGATSNFTQGVSITFQ